MQATDTKSAVLGEVLELIGGIPEDDLKIFKDRLDKRAKVHQKSKYHQAILDRVFPQPGQPVPELPGGQYQSYELIAGKHFRPDQAHVEAARAEYLAKCEEAKRNGRPLPDLNAFPEVRLTEYKAGSIVTPQNDGEALEMLQNPDKWRPLHEERDRISELLAEQNRLKQTDAEKDRIIAQLRAELESK